MKRPYIAFCTLLLLLIVASDVFAKANTVEIFTQAAMTGDIAVLEKVLAPNFWYIGSNGHIRDKEHFIQEIKDKQLIVNHITFTNIRETELGSTRMLTANGTFTGKHVGGMPNGLMRYTLVLANNRGEEQVVLFQATPVIATPECADGNCRIK